jgi:L,D-transpeptidase ErfK/SrfK
LALSSCEMPAGHNGSTTNTAPNGQPKENVNASANANVSAPPISETGTVSTAEITLPVLDSFLADPAFANEVKSKLQITDEQLARLKSMSRDATATAQASGRDIREANDRGARQRAKAGEQVSRVIGSDKASELLKLVATRWSGNDATANAPLRPTLSPPSDTRVVINEPAFRMDFFDNGRLVKSYQIGIGYPEFPLPTGIRKAGTIIFNPSWTPPDSPWVKGKNEAGKTVAAGEKLNPLGVLKIPIGLPSLIHGGKQPGRIGEFASHGCVGLTDVQANDFAQRLANSSGLNLTSEQMAEYKKNRTETKEVKLPKPVSVELRYETITVEDGKLHVYRDVYNRDTNTEDNLRRVLGEYGVTLEQLSEQERTQALNAIQQMSADIGTNPSKLTSARSPNTTEAKSKNAEKVNREKSKQAAMGNVTRSIKGSKEVVIDIASLNGKGYPAPVDLDTGRDRPDQNTHHAQRAAGRKRSPRSGR